ncbi:S-adenosyl-L-methionine-dependent tRNA 4-demethylwyosine synthase [Theileria parva strain Muguga]|uniref:Radical SAM core domain-containing protein n=1 Tax=Theileria parva TaxID=5875 RepID=Q4N9I9_THEPA|nr:S-adenosyl-L-methionine-dependent tRNA 4-demethylwyosine synthase [Theileria parva strain Muguga]EAN33369.1 S-adenosyl-L-methionine-dependent tRNA 4-demethylwyosine synthase [Theileria parva strain Muguga]|eukprot:XP_765652.1 hypothetical protein [Theileria parva strain Muguga]
MIPGRERITIIFSDENGCDSQKLASEIALEYLNVKRTPKCISLNSLLNFGNRTTEDSADFSASDGSFSEFANVLNGNSHSDEGNVIIFIFESHSSGITKLENALNDWLSDFRVDKSIFLNLNFIFVIQHSHPPDTQQSVDNEHNERVGNEDVDGLRELLSNLGSRMLFRRNFYLKSGDVGQILSLIDLISEATSHTAYPNNHTDPHTNLHTPHISHSTNISHSTDNSDSTEGTDETEGTEDIEVDIESLGKLGGMTTVTQRNQLIKQGYKLIGDHSAVKLCRWTKSRVRGHGGCYKHTFYGISSSQCMEMTPSLACANKCVFCWRHHTNPVGTRWKWDQDDPKFIVSESITAHLKLIKELRGIFDTKQKRFNEALRIRHCALSLVGEPIMYPQINQLINELHNHQISSFLVTNAQFPEEMEALVPVTQLYVSIDASDRASLRNIDRPLFRDFWDRFLRCIELLKYRRERTVFRLTLVRNFNMTEQKNEIEGYSNLIRLGEPDFVEVKAVTFCGNVEGNAITMKNVPWHDEVIEYCKALVSTDEHVKKNYSLVCEHRHTCCALIAKNDYCVNGKWLTWINYDKFNELVTSGVEFSGLDYSCETPDWALFGSPEQGFDPEDTRIYTKGRHKLNSV